jgi:hypothetical protein
MSRNFSGGAEGDEVQLQNENYSIKLIRDRFLICPNKAKFHHRISDFHRFHKHFSHNVLWLVMMCVKI